MSGVEDVLAQINDAIDDWEVGPDAMRCNAADEARPPERVGGLRLGEGSFYFLDEVLDLTAPTVREMTEAVFVGTTSVPYDGGIPARPFEDDADILLPGRGYETGREYGFDFTLSPAAVRRIQQAWMRETASFQRFFLDSWVMGCRACRARRSTGPRPLAIDGHAYRRRRRARVRRHR